jgi:hypothetical protein
MSGFDFIITPKFHGVIFSHLLTKPVIALSYHPKIDDLMRAVGHSRYCLDIEHFAVDSLIETFGSLVYNSHDLRAQFRKAAVTCNTVPGIYHDPVTIPAEYIIRAVIDTPVTEHAAFRIDPDPEPDRNTANGHAYTLPMTGSPAFGILIS